jgi:hypothetical protein
MNSCNTKRIGREPAGRARLAHRARDEKPAKMKIIHTVTSDSPDGQPLPPTERNVLWAVVRRADGWTVWRAIELVSPTRCHGLRNSPIGSN